MSGVGLSGQRSRFSIPFKTPPKSSKEITWKFWIGCRDYPVITPMGFPDCRFILSTISLLLLPQSSIIGSITLDVDLWGLEGNDDGAENL